MSLLCPLLIYWHRSHLYPLGQREESLQTFDRRIPLTTDKCNWSFLSCHYHVFIFIAVTKRSYNCTQLIQRKFPWWAKTVPYTLLTKRPLGQSVLWNSATIANGTQNPEKKIVGHRKDDDKIWFCSQDIFMMTSSNGNTFRVTGLLCGEFTGPGEFPAQRPVTQSFDASFDQRLNTRLCKQTWGWWFKTPSRPLRRHRNVS